jgi:hypothetical protein
VLATVSGGLTHGALGGGGLSGGGGPAGCTVALER